MAIRNIPLKALVVNRANDRHGELENETAAIAWLFNEREIHMRNLAKDIVAEGEIYEYPLVWPDQAKFVVFDGNRRVTCLKLLDDPRRAPTTELQKFFREQRALWKGPFPSAISCQVETDRERIDDILFRRHTGTQKGVGQSTWDDRMTSTFVNRTGKGNGPSVADEIEKRLAEAGLLPSRRKLPRSTLNRLLSSEPFRQRVGISMKGGRFHFTLDEKKSLAALAKIARDLTERDLVLNDVWDIAGKQAYLDKLQSDGMLPDPAKPASKDAATRSGSQPAKVKPTAKASPTLRTTLIPQKEFGLVWPGRLQRHHQIWEELQFHLDVHRHPNAISVLLRVLIELALDNYIQSSGVAVQDGDKLAGRLEKAGLHLKAAGKIDAKQLEVLKKFKQGDKLVSADTLNRYVHSPNFAPSPEHLMSMWDSLADVIVELLKA
ncbi:hypothetical protein [Brevundimonas sp. Root1279]|uniref:hypothetical protein n=1 Tax=Brevundimonas sp. Root1279 TaxID=1736443 RepID=UPI0006F7912E|nr:hypothetical protein [Brevundimonas sp. Root1279]KQW81879.1 hypothetical protein ASC65_11375 [Brevundimonas sp. Root1279]